MWQAAIASTIVMFLAYARVLRHSSLTIGFTDMLMEQVVAECLVCGGAAVAVFCLRELLLPDGPWTSMFVAVPCGLFLVLSGGRRGFMLACAGTGTFYLWHHCQACMNELFKLILWCLVLGPAFCTPHAQDQHSMLWLSAMVGAACRLGTSCDDLYHLHGGMEHLNHFFVWAVLTMIAFYLFILTERRRRYLPPGLAQAKFVRLGYLRRMIARGERIRRCQELPPEAFGDFTKALYVIIVSHRWLDRYTCDVPTDAFPGGLRLTTLVSRLNGVFSLQAWGSLCHAPVSEWRRRFRASITGGRDVLLFLDFMCLPQIGRDENGRIVPRTAEEEHVLRECLPNMGALYSTFPVLVLDEVDEGSHPYLMSGWCFSELTIARLGRQLDMFSPEFAEPLLATSFLGRKADILARFGEELEEKVFFNEADRLTVRMLFYDYVLKRWLVDAIRQGNTCEARIILLQLSTFRRQVMLSSCADSMLNTPLHLAVNTGCVQMVRVLRDLGADPRLRNLRGDTAAQWLLVPQLRRAALACRNYTPNRGEHEMLPRRLFRY